MNTITYIARSLSFYRKAHLSTLAGIMISSAVLTGALLVGDSVRQSLISLVDSRLGRTHYAISTPERLVSGALADSLQHKTQSTVAPVLLTEGIALQQESQLVINRVQVLGINERFFQLYDRKTIQLDENEALISENLANELQLKQGDDFLLKIRIPHNHPENSPFVAAETVIKSIQLKVKMIADANAGGLFNLKNNQVAPYNVFIPLETLSRILKMPGRANLFLLTADPESEQLSAMVSQSLSLSDLGIYFADSTKSQLKSDRIFISEQVADQIRKKIPSASYSLTYLVNEIKFRKNETPYSFISASGNQLPDQPLSSGEIVLSDWLANDLGAGLGDTITLRYYKLGPMRQLLVDSACFTVKSVRPLSDPVFTPLLMPDFPGLTEAGNCSDWETGVPIRMDKIRDKDEAFWNQYRGTPKAFISLVDGQRLWGNSFGQYTSIGFTADSIPTAKQIAEISRTLSPLGNGFIIQDVRNSGIRAASMSTDFGELFLSLGFFIILAGILLLSMIYGFHLTRRGAETAILSAIGIPAKHIVRISFYELGLLAIAGSLAGTIVGILYNRLMILGLNTLWIGAIGQTSLSSYISLKSLSIGFGINVLITVFTMFRILLKRLKNPPVQLMKDHTHNMRREIDRNGHWTRLLSLILLIIFLILYTLAILQEKSGFILPLASGAMLMLLLIRLISRLISRTGHIYANLMNLWLLTINQWARHQSRTLITITLLALGTFTIIITGSQQRTSFEGNRVPGTGGFMLWAETTVPIHDDLNSAEGKQKNGLLDEPLLDSVKFFQLPVVEGDDASCLNLHAVAAPTLLGIVPSDFMNRPALSFVQFADHVDHENTWMELTHDSATYIPVIADQTVITWGLQKKTGDTLSYLAETGETLHLVLVAGLANSIFQGNILLDEKMLKKYYPSRYRSQILLIGGPVENRDTLAMRLNYLLSGKGIVIQSTNKRMAAFNTVQNTYLSIFMLLGGLAVLISIAGLGLILLKNIQERRQELAVMQAIGFSQSLLIRILIIEHLSLLISGIFIGLLGSFTTLSLLGLQTMSEMPWKEIVSILVLILFAGAAWISVPAYRQLRQNLISTLRDE